MDQPTHIPVLAKEVLNGLALQPGMRVLDATTGLGGHTRLLAEVVGSNGEIVAFDRDQRNLDIAQERLKDVDTPIRFICDSYANMLSYTLPSVDAMLFDLGYSSVHVDDPERGFSFSKDGPLDMRYDQSQETTAAMIVNQYSKHDLAKLFRVYGEERRAESIAKAIIQARKSERFERTGQLAEVIEATVRRRGKIHPATQVFQALRIAVNDEFGELERGLHAAEEVIRPGGRLAVLTFHSLEDRLVKQFIKQSKEFERINKRVIQPAYNEVKENPRARSAKLRLATRKE